MHTSSHVLSSHITTGFQVQGFPTKVRTAKLGQRQIFINRRFTFMPLHNGRCISFIYNFPSITDSSALIGEVRGAGELAASLFAVVMVLVGVSMWWQRRRHRCKCPTDEINESRALKHA